MARKKQKVGLSAKVDAHFGDMSHGALSGRHRQQWAYYYKPAMILPTKIPLSFFYCR
jgi:hypothetical protein